MAETNWPPKLPPPDVRYLTDEETCVYLRIDVRKSTAEKAKAELRRIRSGEPGLKAAYLGRVSGTGLWSRDKVDAWLNGRST